MSFGTRFEADEVERDQPAVVGDERVEAPVVGRRPVRGGAHQHRPAGPPVAEEDVRVREQVARHEVAALEREREVVPVGRDRGAAVGQPGGRPAVGTAALERRLAGLQVAHVEQDGVGDAGHEVGRRGGEDHELPGGGDRHRVAEAVGLLAGRADRDEPRRPGDQVAHEHVVVAVGVVRDQVGRVGAEDDVAAAAGDEGPVHIGFPVARGVADPDARQRRGARLPVAHEHVQAGAVRVVRDQVARHRLEGNVPAVARERRGEADRVALLAAGADADAHGRAGRQRGRSSRHERHDDEGDDSIRPHAASPARPSRPPPGPTRPPGPVIADANQGAVAPR